MATLTKAGWVATLLVHPVALGREVMGGVEIVVALPTIQTLTMVEVSLDRPPQSAAYLWSMGQGARELEVIARVTKGLAQGGRAQLIGETQITSNALGARGGATWQGNPLPLHQLWTSLGELR